MVMTTLFDCGWSLSGRGVAERRRCDLGNWSPVAGGARAMTRKLRLRGRESGRAYCVAPRHTGRFIETVVASLVGPPVWDGQNACCQLSFPLLPPLPLPSKIALPPPPPSPLLLPPEASLVPSSSSFFGPALPSPAGGECVPTSPPLLASR